MGDLERTAVVVPFRDKPEGKPSNTVGGTANTQTKQGGKAQTEAALAICQDLWLARLGRPSGVLTSLRWKVNSPQIEIRNPMMI
jgi:hypothetical protein